MFWSRFAPVGSCGAAMVFQYNRIFDHSFRDSLLLLAVSSATATTAWNNWSQAASSPTRRHGDPCSAVRYRAGCVGGRPAHILTLIGERSQGRRGPHGHCSIADLDESAPLQPLQHRAYGIA
jgi:hypothetical protein